MKQNPKPNIRGFTLVELVSVMVIGGILASMVAPRFFDRNAFERRGFYDQVIATLRYAQKAAIAQNRFVCVAFSDISLTLTYAATNACPGSNLTSPTGLSPYTVSSPGADVRLSGYLPLYFDALGRPNRAQSITVSGYAAPVTIEAETGYVH
jgi:MSHA pilin protein MshC